MKLDSLKIVKDAAGSEGRKSSKNANLEYAKIFHLFLCLSYPLFFLLHPTIFIIFFDSVVTFFPLWFYFFLVCPCSNTYIYIYMLGYIYPSSSCFECKMHALFLKEPWGQWKREKQSPSCQFPFRNISNKRKLEVGEDMKVRNGEGGVRIETTKYIANGNETKH